MEALNKLSGKNSRFILNGNKELLLSVPSNRSGEVEVTVGGKREFAETLPLVSFEEQTGYYIEGLEPAETYNFDELISQLKSDVESRDMTVKNGGKDFLFCADIVFATRTNVKANVFMSLISSTKGYTVTVGRGSGWSGTHTEKFEGSVESLPHLLKCALAHVDKLSTTKLQVLSKDCNNDEEQREYINGIPKLFANESVEQYFYKQEMPAGVVINQKDRFQIFTSYMAGEKMTFDYKTKDYKTLKGAEKYLTGHGYSVDGKQLDSIDLETFEENVRDGLRRSGLGSSWSDQCLMDCGLTEGVINISRVQIREDAIFGFQYYVIAKFQAENDGQTIAREIQINAREGGQVWVLTNSISKLATEIHNGYKNNDLVFDEDTRTAADKIAYHTDFLNGLQRSIEMTQERVDEYKAKNENHWLKSSEERLESLLSKKKHHENMISRLG